MTRPADNTAANCPACGTTEVETGAPVCSQCGADTPGIADTSELGGAACIGARLADTYIVDGVRWAWEGVTYHGAHIDEANGERVIIAERPATDPDPLADAGLMRPGETLALSVNPFHTEHALLSRFDYSGIVKSRSVFVEDDHAYMVLDSTDGDPIADLGPVTEGEVRAWGLQLCQIVSLLHRQGIVHNGIEPSSFIVDALHHAALRGNICAFFLWIPRNLIGW